MAESQGRVRIITSDGEFEHELRQAEETLVMVDFTADWKEWYTVTTLKFEGNSNKLQR